MEPAGVDRQDRKDDPETNEIDGDGDPDGPEPGWERAPGSPSHFPPSQRVRAALVKSTTSSPATTIVPTPGGRSQPRGALPAAGRVHRRRMTVPCGVSSTT